jgi:hypothetical protein
MNINNVIIDDFFVIPDGFVELFDDTEAFIDIEGCDPFLISDIMSNKDFIKISFTKGKTIFTALYSCGLIASLNEIKMTRTSDYLITGIE